MLFIKVYNNDSDPYGLKGHSIFKSVRPFIFGYVVIPKLHEWCLRRHVRAASAEAVSFYRTFGDEAWSQQYHRIISHSITSYIISHQRHELETKSIFGECFTKNEAWIFSRSINILLYEA
jgi:hypothetical protein